MIRNYKDLRVWGIGMELSVAIYKATESFPKAEMFGLVSQMRRAAISVPSNIAEGFSRQHKNEFIQFLYIAKGSASELDTHIDLSERLGFIDSQTTLSLQDQTNAIGMMLHGLITKLKRENRKVAPTAG
ncbi:MAG: four helix bundle protein [Armatimonadota bacterium]|nr:four helix bundle protein [Armatimonadota bacterium]